MLQLITPKFPVVVKIGHAHSGMGKVRHICSFLCVIVPLLHVVELYEPRYENLCENKGTDQLRSNCEADQCLYFRYTDSTTPLLLKSEISSF